MRLSAICTSLACIAILSISPAFAQTGPLTGKMEQYDSLFGNTWQCTTSVPATQGQPARSMSTLTLFEAAPNNVLHVRTQGDNYKADQYIGYSADQNAYWSSSSDINGMVATTTSQDGKVYSGSFSMRGATGKVTHTYSWGGQNQMSIRTLSNSKTGSTTTTTSCSR